MSFAGDLSFIDRIRETLRVAVAEEQDRLVVTIKGRGRAAGHIQGLKDALILIDSELQRITQPPPEDKNG
jgi:hypothetical protein